jgi:hypothetical protein
MDHKDASELLRPSVERVRPGSLEEAEALDRIDAEREARERADDRRNRRRTRIEWDDGGYR